jgi:CTP:molybdopterin cytidylyltransferase MocA
MLSSVRCGLRALPASCQGVLVVLGDQPSVTPGLVTALIAAFRDSGRGIVVPAWNGRRGHPMLLAARFREEVLRQHDGVGLRGVLSAHPEEVLEIDAGSPAVLDDMDTPEDYAREKTRHTPPGV